MAATTNDLFWSYVRGLRWQVPLALVAVLGMWALDVDGMRSYGIGPVLLVGLGFVFVVGPLVWLRVEHFGRSDRPFWIFLGLSVAWLVVSTLVLLVVVALVVGD